MSVCFPRPFASLAVGSLLATSLLLSTGGLAAEPDAPSPPRADRGAELREEAGETATVASPRAVLARYTGLWVGDYEFTDVTSGELQGTLRARHEYRWGEVDGEPVLFATTTFQVGGEPREAEGVLYHDGRGFVMQVFQDDRESRFRGRLLDAQTLEWRKITDEGEPGEVIIERIERDADGQILLISDALQEASPRPEVPHLRQRGVAVKVAD